MSQENEHPEDKFHEYILRTTPENIHKKHAMKSKEKARRAGITDEAVLDRLYGRDEK
jgi:hypothetical protein